MVQSGHHRIKVPMCSGCSCNFRFTKNTQCNLLKIKCTGQIKLVTLLQPDGETEHRGLLPDCAGFLGVSLTSYVVCSFRNQLRDWREGDEAAMKNHRRVVDTA